MLHNYDAVSVYVFYQIYATLGRTSCTTQPTVHYTNSFLKSYKTLSYTQQSDKSMYTEGSVCCSAEKIVRIVLQKHF